MPIYVSRMLSSQVLFLAITSFLCIYTYGDRERIEHEQRSLRYDDLHTERVICTQHRLYRSSIRNRVE